MGTNQRACIYIFFYNPWFGHKYKPRSLQKYGKMHVQFMVWPWVQIKESQKSTKMHVQSLVWPWIQIKEAHHIH